VTAYLCEKFPALITEKLRVGICDGPQIRCLMQDKHILFTMTTLGKNLAVLYSSCQTILEF